MKKHVPNRTSFMMTMIHDYEKQLELPPEFVKRMRRCVDGEYRIRVWGCGGRYCWIVEVNKDRDGLFFRNGWPEFIEDNRVSLADVLLFIYEGRSKFLVKIFNPSGLKRNMKLAVQREDELGVEKLEPKTGEDDDDDDEHLNMDLDEPPILYVDNEGECHLEVGGEQEKEMPGNMEQEPSQNRSLGCFDAMGEKGECHLKVGGEQEAEKPAKAEREGFRFMEVEEETEKESGSGDQIQNESSGHFDTVGEKELGSAELMQNKSVDCFAVTVEKEQRITEPNQKETSFFFEDEKKETIKKTITLLHPFSSIHTYFMVTWSPAWQHYVRIPEEIAAEKDLHSKSQLVIMDPKGNTWLMKLSKAEDGNMYLSEKWSNFCEAFKLKEGDICTFEFTSSRIVHVHILCSGSISHTTGH